MKNIEDNLIEKRKNFSKSSNVSIDGISDTITIDVDELRNFPDNCITDVETIRQIALYGIKTGDNSLNSKIKEEYEYCGLYPQTIRSLDIQPELK